MCAWGEKVENHWNRVKKNVFISPTSNAIRYIKSKQWRLYPNISVTRETFHFGPCAFHLQSSFLRISPLCPRCCKLPSLTPSSFSCATDTSKLPSRKGVPLIIAMCCNWKVTRLSSISKKKKLFFKKIYVATCQRRAPHQLVQQREVSSQSRLLPFKVPLPSLPSVTAVMACYWHVNDQRKCLLVFGFVFAVSTISIMVLSSGWI